MIYKSIYKSKTSKLILNRFVRLTVASVFGLSLFALAQAAPAAGAATAPDSPSAAAAAASKATGTKVGTINIEQAIFLSNQGQRDFAELAKKFEPKQNDLKAKADEIDSLKKQLAAQQDKLNDAARDKLVKEVETKQKSFDRSTQDAQEDFQAQQGEIGNKILTVMAPLIVKYASDNGYGMILDTSQQWPRGPVIWYGPAVDITQPVIEAFNVQSGVPAPAAGSSPTKPVKPVTKPAVPATPKK
ncbi:MAG: OmpH family outer membrane protein [Terriglobales bacterium]|jgi:outer membrane protein